MKYGKHLETKKNLEWAQYYLDYSGLKDIIKVRSAVLSVQSLRTPCASSIAVSFACETMAAGISQERMFRYRA